jgi:hypothetical protein
MSGHDVERVNLRDTGHPISPYRPFLDDAMGVETSRLAETIGDLDLHNQSDENMVTSILGQLGL